VATCLASTAGRRNAAKRIEVPSLIRVVVAAIAVSTVSGSNQLPSGPVGCVPPAVQSCRFICGRTPMVLNMIGVR
jgi:hypothetical protein